jgi:hypothetical protein
MYVQIATIKLLYRNLRLAIIHIFQESVNTVELLLN